MWCQGDCPNCFLSRERVCPPKALLIAAGQVEPFSLNAWVTQYEVLYRLAIR